MTSQQDENYTFTCPECAESLEVNDPMKEALLEQGCVICSASVTSEAFTPISSPSSV